MKAMALQLIWRIECSNKTESKWCECFVTVVFLFVIYSLYARSFQFQYVCMAIAKLKSQQLQQRQPFKQYIKWMNVFFSFWSRNKYNGKKKNIKKYATDRLEPIKRFDGEFHGGRQLRYIFDEQFTTFFSNMVSS